MRRRAIRARTFPYPWVDRLCFRPLRSCSRLVGLAGGNGVDVITDGQEVIKMWPACREPHNHATSTGDNLGGDLDQVGAPGTSEPLTQGVTLAAAIEKPLAMGFINRGSG